MKRSNINNNSNLNKLIEHKRRIAFHEAGHSAAIYFNTNSTSIPPISFKIIFNDLNDKQENYASTFQTDRDDGMARVEGGRLIGLLPASPEEFARQFPVRHERSAKTKNDYLIAFDTDIINLLAGPLAEARHVAQTDNEPFNRQLVNLKALKNYGGVSDLVLIKEYMQVYSSNKLQQEEKLDQLLAAAYDFVIDRTYWAKITQVADYFLNCNKNLISFEEVAALLEK